MHRFWDIRLQIYSVTLNRVRQGHWNHHSIQCIWLPINVPLHPWAYLVPFPRKKRRFQSKIAKFTHPRVLCAPTERVPLGIEYQRSGSKTRIMGLLGRERSLTISSAVWIQYTNVTDRQMDGRTPGDSKDRGYSVARYKSCISNLQRFFWGKLSVRMWVYMCVCYR